VENTSFSLQSKIVSKSDVVKKVIPAADFCMSADDLPKITKKWLMCVKATASQTWDIF